MMRRKKSLINRLCNKFIIEDEPRVEGLTPCWIWTASTNADGYGHIWGDNCGKIKRATRLVWEIVNGPIPDELNVLHKCDIPACINPDHLFLGTQKDNVRDAIIKSRFASHIGESNPNSIATVEDVIRIRAVHSWMKRGRILAPRGTYARLACIFNLPIRAVVGIICKESWRHVECLRF